MLFNLHSIINNGLIPGGQDSSKRQTVFFLPIDPRDKGHQDPAHIDCSVPRRAQYLHSAWKKHQQSCGEVQHATFSQLTKPKPKPICDRSGKPDSTEDVFVVKSETSRSHEIDEKGLHEELGSSDRSVKPDKLSENTRVKQAHDGTGQLVERNSSSAHTVKEQFAPEENGDICIIQHGQRVQPCNQRGEHRLQHSRITTFCSETITWRQRSKFDSEDREPPSSTCTSK